jgi:hypothetical protein
MNAKYLFLSILFAFATFLATAQKGQDGKGGDSKTTGKGAAMFINRTGDIIVKTHKTVKTNKVYTGYLHKAQEKQVNAIELFKANNMKEAVKNSYVARRYAFMAYEANSGTVPVDWKMNENEVRVVHRMLPKPPQDSDLKAEVSNTDKKTEEDETPTNAPNGTEKVGDETDNTPDNKTDGKTEDKTNNGKKNGKTNG